MKFLIQFVDQILLFEIDDYIFGLCFSISLSIIMDSLTYVDEEIMIGNFLHPLS